MNDKLQDALVKLAEKLGTTAEHLWGVLLLQARVEVIVDVMTLLVSIGAALALARFWYWYFKKYEDLVDGPIGLGLPGVIVTVGTFIFLVVGIIGAFEIPTLLFNPEYWALREILGSIK